MAAIGRYLRAFWRSPAWGYRALRVGLIAAAGWAVLQAAAPFAYQERPWSSEWPRTDFKRATVHLSEIESGGPPKDGIPAIDEPKYISPAEAADWLHAREPVIVVERKRAARAYPLQILIYHEIVNDVFLGDPIAVTFCPLCNASLVFDRVVGGRVLDFGTTGKLRHSDLVMYDRQSESWWQQFTGQGIVGKYAGTTLITILSQIVSFEDFRAAYPQGEVLSRRTGFFRPYGSNPYRGYDRIGDQPFRPHDPKDARLPAMERVLAVSRNGRHKIYPYRALAPNGVLYDRFAGARVAIFTRANTFSVLDESKIVDSRLVPAAAVFEPKVGAHELTLRWEKDEIVDRETGSRWNMLGQAVSGPLAGQRLTRLDNGVHFAFAWLAFNPETEVFHAKK